MITAERRKRQCTGCSEERDDNGRSAREEDAVLGMLESVRRMLLVRPLEAFAGSGMDGETDKTPCEWRLVRFKLSRDGMSGV